MHHSLDCMFASSFNWKETDEFVKYVKTCGEVEFIFTSFLIWKFRADFLILFEKCYGLNCVPHQIHMLKPQTPMWLDLETGPLKNN